MYEPIFVGEVSPDAESWYQLDYYGLFSGRMPWMVFATDDISTAFKCWNYAQWLDKVSGYGQVMNLYSVHRDGSYMCLRTNVPADHRARTIEPFGNSSRLALHQLRTAGDYCD